MGQEQRGERYRLTLPDAVVPPYEVLAPGSHAGVLYPNEIIVSKCCSKGAKARD